MDLVDLFDDLGDDASTDSSTTFANSKAQTFFHSDWNDKSNFRATNGITWHNHFGSFRKS